MSYINREHVVKVPLSITNLIEIWFYRIVAVAIVLSLTFFVENARAGVFHTGNTMYSRCTDTSDIQSAACVGYLQGALDMMEGELACTPSTMTGRQAKDIFVKFMAENPEIRDKRADHLMIMIFGTLYPCQKQAAPPIRVL